MALDICTIEANRAVGGAPGDFDSFNGWGRGGGLYGSGTMQLANSAIISNSADNGGGIFSEPFAYGNSSIALTNTMIVSNSARADGGGIRNVCHYTYECTFDLIRTNISNNSANRGGGLYHSGASANTPPVVSFDGTLISHNSTSYKGAFMTKVVGESPLSI
jgi:hypothetical protein